LSKRLEPLLPEPLAPMFDGSSLDEHLNKVFLLITIDERGYPYVAMLSLLELTCTDRANIRLAPWNNSTTTANMRRDGKVTLVVIDTEMAYYIQGTATELAHELPGFPGMAKINIRIDAVLQDKALDYEGAARVSTGIRFENPDMDAAYLERAHRVLEALKQ
jgi:hypothetical protein